MTLSLIALQTTGQFIDFSNLLGVALVLGYAAAHRQRKRAQNADVERTWRERETAVLVVFVGYALVVSTFGPQQTWVATVGATIDTNIQQFATELSVVGQQTRATTPTERVLGTLKSLGLVAYVLLFSVVSFSNAAANRLVQFVSNLP